MGTCEYGCGQEAQYTLSSGKQCCSPKYQKCPEVRRKNSWSRGKTAFSDSRLQHKFRKEEYFTVNSNMGTTRIKGIILAEKLLEYKCLECGINPEWNGKALTLQLDHINGRSNDHRLENLRFLCPNCHTQTPTYTGRNRRSPVTEEKFVEALKNSTNIRQALIKLGFSDNCHYHKAWRLACKYNLEHLVRKKREKIVKCGYCGRDFKTVQGKFCSVKCSSRSRVGRNTKIKWPSSQELQQRIKKSNVLTVAKELGVSDNAVRKRLRNHP